MFTGVDPFSGFPETPYSLNPYQYAYSAPTTWTDPTGACVGWIWGDPTCAFIGWERVERGALTYDDATPWAGAGADFTPIVGDVKGVIEVFTGCDLITGEDLGWWRLAGLVGLSELRQLRRLGYRDDLNDIGTFGQEIQLPPGARVAGGGSGGLAAVADLTHVPRFLGQVLLSDVQHNTCVRALQMSK